MKKNTINSRCVILVKFLDHQLELQLHALYALQALDLKMEHPPSKFSSSSPLNWEHFNT